MIDLEEDGISLDSVCHPNGDFIIGITAGVFDLLHIGHLIMLQYAASKCDYLVVCVQVDPSKYRSEKERPIETIFERTVRLEACKYVQKVISYETEEDLEAILKTFNYNIRFIGSDHQGLSFTGDNIRPDTFCYNPRDHSYSSTALKDRVVKGRQETKRPKPKAKDENTPSIFDEEDLRMDKWLSKKTKKERKKK